MAAGRRSRVPGEAAAVGPAPATLSEDQLRRSRLQAQGLCGRQPRQVAAAVRAVTGLQAQDTPASRLAVRARTSGLDVAAVRRACDQDRSVVRTWAMRGTLHLVAASDAAWLVGLLGPGFARGNRRRRLQLGLDDQVCERALRALPAVLGDGPLSRGELVRRLAGEGVRVEPAGQAPAHLVGYAAMQGLVCRGPDLEGDEASYVLLADWVGDGRAAAPPDPLAELARRYLRGHGPAGPEDLAAWSGLPVGQARRAFERVAAELRSVEAAGRRLWLPGDAPTPWGGAGGTRARSASKAGGAGGRTEPADPLVRLLPRFDDYLLGWRGRDLVLDPRFATRIQAGGGWIHAAVVVDGRVVGTWKARRQARRGDAGEGLEVAVEPFGRLPAGARPGLEAEVADLSRFLGVDARLRLVRG